MHHDAYFPPKLQHKQYTASVEALSLHKIRPRRTIWTTSTTTSCSSTTPPSRGCKLKIAGPLIEYGFGAGKKFSVLCSTHSELKIVEGQRSEKNISKNADVSLLSYYRVNTQTTKHTYFKLLLHFFPSFSSFCGIRYIVLICCIYYNLLFGGGGHFL